MFMAVYIDRYPYPDSTPQITIESVNKIHWPTVIFFTNFTLTWVSLSFAEFSWGFSFQVFLLVCPTRRNLFEGV